jgi:hypothetical protein
MPSENKSVKALNDNATLREQEAHNDLVNALNRIVNGKTINIKVKPMEKITPVMLSKEANRSRSIIYDKHRYMLRKIDQANNKRGPTKRSKRLLDESKEQKKQKIINQLNEDKKKLAQENYRLQLELQSYKEKINRLENNFKPKLSTEELRPLK